MLLPKNKIPNSLLKGVFTPEEKVREVVLNELLQQGAKIKQQEQVKETIKQKALNPLEQRIPIPLTEAEAEEVDAQILATKQRITDARNKLTSVRNQLTEAINNLTNGQGLSFQVDVSKKPRVKRALRKLFNEDLTEITYDMYLEMLQAKVNIEKAEVADYAQGKLK